MEKEQLNSEQITKFQRFVNDCSRALGDANFEKCIEILEQNLGVEAGIQESELIEKYADLIVYKSRLVRTRQAMRRGLISFEQGNIEFNQITVSLQEFVSTLEPRHVSLFNRIHDRIIVFTYENCEIDWKGLFNEAFFSHASVVFYGKEIPPNYRTPDVVIFDDSGPNARPYMVQYAEEMPQAHFLYFGETNPFTESRKRNPQDAAIFDRCANANSKFTVHARLRELLEFRKIYGVPSAVSF